MSDVNGKSPAPTSVRTFHLVEGQATSVSTDGTVALLMFKCSDGEQLSLTLPSIRIAQLRGMVADLTDTAKKRGVGVGNVAPLLPRDYAVGNSDAMRGAVLLMFNRDAADERVIALTDASAMQLSKAMRDNVLERMSPQERAKTIAGLTLPAASKLILPG
jgi:hypothetical protein